jgi:type VI secretion system secreted protein VgrG
MEVMVAFVDGDPDRPLVTGIVPNPANAVPYDLPANKTRSVFKTNTHKGHGHNELRFEDDAGREEIFIHAQKDMYTAVEDSNVRIVGSNDHTIIEANQHETVRNNKETQVGGFNIEQIGYMDIRTVTAPAAGLNFISKTMKTDSSWGEFDFVTLLNSTKLAGLAVAGGIEPFSSVSFVQGSAILNTGTDWRVTVGRNAHIDVEGDYSCSADGSTHDEADGSKIFAAGENFEVYAGKTLILACGESHIELSEDGAIRIVGKTIEIKAGRVDIN